MFGFEVLIAFCHIIALPATLCVDFENPSILLIACGIIAGCFQLWAVIWKGCLKYRLIAVQVATIIAISTVENLISSGLFSGSRVCWLIIMLFAAWNTIRVFKEKLERHG